MHNYDAVIYKTHFPNQLFVGCFLEQNKSNELRKFLSKFGRVIEAKCSMNETGKSRVFGFICILPIDATDRFIEDLSEDFEGMRINTKPAIKRIRKDSTGMHGI